MDNNTRPNDWVAAIFFNPDKDIQDLTNLGITPSTSDIKSKEFYKSQPEIVEFFTNDRGKFNDVEFNNFYNSAVSLYNSEEVNNLSSNLLETFEYDKYDILAPENAKRFDSQPTFIKYANPLRQSRGVSDLYKWGAPTMSMREIGQANKIFNPETGEFENKTPNDLSFLEVLGSNLVLASWDEDGYHDENGRQVAHMKGDLKFNNEGDPYYEYLNGRSSAGKELLHITDVLTEDGSSWNKYDFFDADGLDKNIGGTIMRTVATIAPAFFPGFGQYYAAAGVALELGKLIPDLYKSIEGLLGGDTSNDYLANDIKAWFTKFDYNTSDAGRKKMFNAENIGKMVSSSSMQLVQQKLVGKIPALLNGNKYSENAVKWGRGLALSYMAGTSTTGTFDAFKEAGASDFVAGLGSVASIFAMKTLMDSDYFREFWFNGTPLAKGEFKKALREAADEVQKSINAGTLKSNKAKASFIKKTSDVIVKHFKKLQTSGLFSSSLNEGIEETMEEISFDTIKAISSALNSFGIFDKGIEYDFGFSLQGNLSRYISSFAGGAIGGSVFHLHDKAQNWFDGVTNEVAKREGFQEMIYLIRNGKAGELRSELEKWYKNGKLGSTNLSAVDGKIVKDANGTGIVYDKAKDGESHNDIIFKQISNMIDRVEGVLNEENLKISDIDLEMYRSMSQDDLSGLDDDSLRYLIKTHRLDTIQEKLGENSGLVSGIFQDWNTLANSLVSTKIQLENLLKPKETDPKTPSDVDAHISAVKKSSEYKYLSDKLNKLRERRDSIIKGEKHDYYTGQLIFSLQPELAATFGAIIGKDQFSLNKFGHKYTDLSEEDKAIVDELYKNYSLKEKDAAFKAYDVYYNLVQTYKNDINKTSEKLEEYSKLFSGELHGDMVDFDSQIKKREDQINLEKEKENPNNDIISKLQSEISDLKFQQIKSMMTRHVIGDAQEILRRGESKHIVDLANGYTSWLEYLSHKKLFLESNDYELNRILKFLGESYNNYLEGLKKLHKENKIGGPYYYQLKEKIEKILTNISSGNVNEILNNLLFFDEKVKTVENYLLDIISEEVENDEVDKILLFLNKIINPVFTNSQNVSIDLLSFITKVNKLRSELIKNNSPINSLFEKLLIDINPELVGVMKMIVDEINKLSNLENLEDYLIHNQDIVDKLYSVKNLIPVIYALIHNRDIIPNNENGISDTSEIVLSKELNILYNQISRLIALAEANNAQKLVEQDKIKINMRKKFADILINPDSTVARRLSANFDFDLEKIVKEIGFDSSEITTDNYDEFEKKVIQLETAIYENIRKSGKTLNETVDLIFEIFNKEDITNRDTTKMTKDKNIKIAPYDQLMYIISLVGYPRSNFYNLYREKIGKLQLAPIFSQEYSIACVYSLMKSPDLLNAVLAKMKKLSDDNAEKYSEKDLKEYIQSRPTLDNILPLISGGAGTGKTAGVDKILYDMLIDNCNVITCAPEQSQTDNLTNNVGHNGKSVTVSELVTSIIGRQLDKSVDSDDTQFKTAFRLTDKVQIQKDSLFKQNGKQNVLFIDEYSLIDAPTLELISKWAKENGVLVIKSGDNKQNKAVLPRKANTEKDANGNPKILYTISGVEDFISIYLPELTVSLRVGNVAKSDNYDNLNIVLTELYDYLYKNPEVDSAKLSQHFEKTILHKHKITLKYFNENGEFDGGEKIVKSNDIDSYIDQISKKTNNYVVIHNGQDKYANKINDPHYIHRKDVQGKEYEYIIIDLDWSKNPYGDGYRDLFQRLSDLYALSQRSIKGSIINEEGLDKFSINNIEDNSSSATLSMNQDQISRYRSNRIKELTGIAGDILLIDFMEPEKDDNNVDDEPQPSNDDKQEQENNVEEPTFIDPVDNTDNENQTNTNVLPPMPPLPPVDSYTEEEDITNEGDQQQGDTGGTRRTVKPDRVVIDSGIKKHNKFYSESCGDETFDQYAEMNSIVALDDEERTEYMWLRSWILFGYYKNDPVALKLKNILGVKNKIYKMLSDGNHYLKIGIQDKHVVAWIKEKGNDKISWTIPLLKKPESLVEWSDDYDFEVYKIPNGIKLDSHRKQYSPEMYGIDFQVSMPYVFSTGESFETLSSEERNESDEFEIRNEGNTMFCVCCDPFVENINEFFTEAETNISSSESETWQTSKDPRFQLVGINMHVFSMDDIISLRNKLGNKIFSKNIVNNYIANSILKTIYELGMLDKLIIQYFKNCKIIYGSLTNDVEKNKEIYKNATDIVVDGKISEDFIINFIRENKVYPITLIYEHSDGSIHHKSTGDILNSILNFNKKVENPKIDLFTGDSKFKNGMKLNSLKEFDTKVNDNSNWYKINRAIDWSWSTDIGSIPNPIFRIVTKTKTESEPDQTPEEIEKLEEELVINNEEQAISNSIKSKYGDDATFDNLVEEAVSKNGKNKIFSLSLHINNQYMKKYVIVHDGKVVSNLDNSSTIDYWLRNEVVWGYFLGEPNIDLNNVEDLLWEMVGNQDLNEDEVSSVMEDINNVFNSLNCE